jgi:hypothetical protein
MTTNFMSFLQNVVVENVDLKTPRSSGGIKKQRNPESEFQGFRVWSDGSVYPSAFLVTKYNLEYPAAVVSPIKDRDGKDKNVFTVVGNQGNGLDIVDTRQWSQIKGGGAPFIAVAITPKDAPKLDMFSQVRYNVDGTPISSVLDQGAATFGKETLLPMLKEIYNVEPNAEGYLDVQVITELEGGMNLRSTNGKPDYTRRENVDIFMLFPIANALKVETGVPEVDEEPVADMAQVPA